MTRRRQLRLGLALTMVFLSVALIAGCARQTPIRNRTTSYPAGAPAATITDDKKGGESALREQTLREQGLREQDLRDRALREQTLRDQSARGKVPESAGRGSAGKEGAIPKEAQIPDIYFDYNAYNLTPESAAILKEAAQTLLRQPKYSLLIEGHCDERGTAEYNLALGQKRADEAAKFLMDLGIAKERIKTISYGKEKPLDPGHDEAAFAKNRRDHFVVSESAK
ncbi:MAG: peptidoglycan-associated lipoprotein Pal [Deltaproteobacteria bacterium]|nr:peptidoglycan-associated lipoprotein Pal [Deltaproteobacteria bacterium]